METGIGPVFAFADFRVKWTFTGFDGLELGTEENEEKGDAQSGEDQRLKEEGEELAFHGINGIRC